MLFQHGHSAFTDDRAHVSNGTVTEDVVDAVMITLDSRCRNVLHQEPIVSI